MRSIWRVAVAAVVVLSTAVGGVGLYPSVEEAAAEPSAGLGYVPLAAPCRVVDTRQQAEGRVTPVGAAPGSREFRVAGNGALFASQGGRADGCDIPDGVDAVEVSLTAVSPSGIGFVRLTPNNGAQPNATFLNFAGTGITNTGTVTLSDTPERDLKVWVYGAATHIALDVQGYFTGDSGPPPGFGEIAGAAVVSNLVSGATPPARQVKGCVGFAVSESDCDSPDFVAEVGADGVYSAVVPQGTYTLFFEYGYDSFDTSSNPLSSLLSGLQSSQPAVTNASSVGRTVQAVSGSVTTVDFAEALPAGLGSVTGIVSITGVPSGASPVREVRLCATEPPVGFDDCDEGTGLIPWRRTAADGSFEIPVAPGSYWLVSKYATFDESFFAVPAASSVQSVTVTSGNRIARNASFTWATTGSIVGNISFTGFPPGSDPDVLVEVCAGNEIEDPGVCLGTSRSFELDALGPYRIDLPPGVYSLQATARTSNGSGLFGGSGPPASTSYQVVTVTAGGSTTLNLSGTQTQPVALLTGTVQSSGGNALVRPNLWVVACPGSITVPDLLCSSFGARFARVAIDGSFKLDITSVGSASVFAYYDFASREAPLAFSASPGTTGFGAVTQLNVTAGSSVVVQPTVSLPSVGAVAGSASVGGEVPPDAQAYDPQVCISPIDQPPGSCTTEITPAPDGSFARVLSPGSYRIGTTYSQDSHPPFLTTPVRVAGTESSFTVTAGAVTTSNPSAAWQAAGLVTGTVSLTGSSVPQFLSIAACPSPSTAFGTCEGGKQLQLASQTQPARTSSPYQIALAAGVWNIAAGYRTTPFSSDTWGTPSQVTVTVPSSQVRDLTVNRTPAGGVNGSVPVTSGVVVACPGLVVPSTTCVGSRTANITPQFFGPPGDGQFGLFDLPAGNWTLAVAATPGGPVQVSASIEVIDGQTSFIPATEFS
jgi:hypothetical protein